MAARDRPRRSACALRRLKSRERRTARAQSRALLPGASAARAALRLLDRHFEAVGMSFVEMAIGWFWPIERLLERVAIDGASTSSARCSAAAACCCARPLHDARGRRRGARVARRRDVSCMYRPQRNAMMDVMIRRGRSRFAKEQIPRDNVRLLCASCARTMSSPTCPTKLISASKASCCRSSAIPQSRTPRRASSRRSAAPPCCPISSGACRITRDYRVDIGPPLPTSRARTQRRTRGVSFAAARGVHPARARAVLMALQEIQGPAAGVSRRVRHARDGARRLKPR